MIYILITIFFIQLLIIINYFYHYLIEDSQFPRSSKRLTKFCYISTIGMLGGLLFVLVKAVSYGDISSSAGDIYDSSSGIYVSGSSGLRDIGDIFDAYYWNDVGSEEFLNEFLFGYFITIVIIFLVSIRKKL